MTTAPPRLVVHALPGNHARDVAQGLVQATKDSTTPAELVSADIAGQHIDEAADALLCLVYEDPIHALGKAMSAKADVTAFLRDWTSSAVQSLDLHRRNRRRSVIFEAGHLQRYAAAGLARLGIDADSRALGDLTGTPAPLAPLDYILAQAVLAEAEDAQVACEELHASAQILSNEAGLTPANMALQAYKALHDTLENAAEHQRQARDTEQELRQTLEEKTAYADLLSAQQSDMVSDIEALEQELEDIRMRIEESEGRLQAEQDARAQLITAHDQETSQLKQAIEEKSASADVLRAQQSDMISDMEALEQKLEDMRLRSEESESRLQAELKAQQDAGNQLVIARDQKTSELKQALETLEHTSADLSCRDAELDEARREIDRIMNSRSMRLTGSLRRLSGLFRRNR